MSTEKSNGISRKAFIKGTLGAAGLIFLGGMGGCDPFATPSLTGKVKGASHERGHLLRNISLPSSTSKEQVEILIVGAGVAGLSAARWLKKNGIENFKILELEPLPGGNSAAGKNKTSAYPWGAHYLPAPGLDNPELVDFLNETGVVLNIDSTGVQYDSQHFCHSPKERLYIHGIWQDGLLPATGLTPTDQAQIESFQAFTEQLTLEKGTDGKYAFAIPLDTSSQDEAYLAWDTLSMSAFMEQKGWTSSYLKWYINYCCKDDYGATAENTSAWAALHYFCSRKGYNVQGEGDDLTWPEGNNWLIQRLLDQVGDHVQCNSLVMNILPQAAEGAKAIVYNPETHACQAIQAKKIIFCGPQFVAAKVIEGFNHDSSQHTYAPWVVANITVKRRPEGTGARLSWDNVNYGSDSLGYIVADHQSLKAVRPKETVLTWYYPMSHLPPKQAREEALAKDWEAWKSLIIADLESMHQGIEEQILTLDVWLWGHGMISPQINFLWSEERKNAKLPIGNVHFAHSDLSGISIFEEAFYQGIRAAKEVLNQE